MERRVPEPEEDLLPRCRNCEAPLRGPYCSACGQLTRGSARSMATLIAEARDALVHLDGRLWRTLRALAFRPGLLTEEFFQERRARYVHPFRLYLVLSVVFFSLTALSGLSPRVGAPLKLEVAADAPGELGLAEAEAESRAARAAAEACAGLEAGDAFRAALFQACTHHVADRGRALGRAVWANVPRMMFLFLPLLALAMKALYWRPRRYYVEHLVFFLHCHAAVFLFIGLALLLGNLGRLARQSWVSGLASFAASWWLSWYLWRAMRAFYGQGVLRTLGKLLALSLAYLVFLSITLVGTLVVSALWS